MSFCSGVKSQIASGGPTNGCCMRAETYGLLLFSHLLTKEKHVFKTEQSCTARLIAELIAVCCGAYAEIQEGRAVGGERVMYNVSIPEADQRERVLASFGITADQADDIDSGIIESDCCREAFLRGAFLASGSVSAPDKAYHMEFSSHSEKVCAELKKLLRKHYGINSSVSPRRKSYCVYIKEGDGIESMLALIGAGDAYYEMVNIRIFRDVQNRANRAANCDNANISKTINAAQTQIAAIKTIQHTIGLESLPSDLREIAELRLSDSEMSLREMGENLTVPLSRSGVNHRIKRLLEIADECRKECKGEK